MRLEVGDDRVPVYLDQVRDQRPERVTLEGRGSSVGKTAWVALVLEREEGYAQQGVDLDRVVGPGDADLARLSVVLEVQESSGPGNPRTGPG